MQDSYLIFEMSSTNMEKNPREKISLGKAIVLVIAVAVIVGCVSIILQTHREMFVRESVGAGSSSVTPTAEAAGLGSSYNAPALPARLTIPSIGVDANIQAVGMSWSGVNIGVPTNFTDVGWFKYGPRPGMPGTAVIDGHLDGKYVPQAIFFNLQNLKAGDAVDVTDASGTILHFQVVASAVYDYDASTSDIFAGNATGTRLDLITCAGDWLPSAKLYDKRIVVFTELVSGSIHENPSQK
jgi:sortase (surface protein transpeptidase)